MPTITLIVCLYKERDFLERLLKSASGCYDNLLVIHDGRETEDAGQLEKSLAIDFSLPQKSDLIPGNYRIPALPAKSGSIHELVLSYGGRFYEGPRSFQQEPHWPFAWRNAGNNWILRLDADEFPSEELKSWLKEFRNNPEPDPEISGYTCIWPLWNGKQAITKRWPNGRLFLFHRERVRFFGMAEQSPLPDFECKPIDLILNHQPRRKSTGITNIIFRRQAYHWRRVIIQSLLGKPTELPCWRWNDPNWPPSWEVIRLNPLQTALDRLIRFPIHNARSHWKYEHKIFISDVVNPGLHHFLLCVGFWWRSKIGRSNVKKLPERNELK